MHDQPSAAYLAHHAATTALEQQWKARRLALPTADRDVCLALRAKGEPKTLFGEGPYERRERLREVVAATGGVPEVIPTSAPETKAVGDDELFFTEGSGELYEARRWIAAYSLPRAYERLKKTREFFQTQNLDKVEATNELYRSKLKMKIVSSQIGDVRPLTACTLSADGARLATASFNPLVKVWTMSSDGPCNLALTLEDAHAERVHGLAWHPKYVPGARSLALASADAAGVIALWNESSSDSNQLTMSRLLNGHEERVSRLAFHPGGRHLASTSHDEVWTLWDVESGKALMVQEGHSRPVFGVAFHPDGSLVATSDLGGIIRTWDLRTGRTVCALCGHIKAVYALDFNPLHPHILASGSGDKSVKFWDLRKQDCFENLPCHSHLISTVRFEPGRGRFILTGSHDGTARLWANNGDLSCFQTLPGHEGFLMNADISQDGCTIATAGFDRTFKIWHGGAGKIGE